MSGVRPLAFYLFSLPAWEAIAGWLLTIAIIVALMSLFFLAVGGGLRAIAGRSIVRSAQPGLRGVALHGDEIYVLEHINPNSETHEDWPPRIRKISHGGKITTLITFAPAKK